jgi:hypothetical protein
VDFASRECQEQFFRELEKTGASVAGTGVVYEPPVLPARSSSFDSNCVTASGGSTRYIAGPISSRSRASSFSRPGQPISGAGSPNSTPSAGSTPRHLSTTSERGGARCRQRYMNSTSVPAAGEYYDSSDYLIENVTSSSRQRFRNYDECSHGSGASHEDLYEDPAAYYHYSSRERMERAGAESPPPPSTQPISIQSRLGGVVVDESQTSITSSSMRRRCDKDKSPGEFLILFFD